jgi:hypothetical protein
MGSARTRMPKTAACTVSVFEKAVPTTKFLNEKECIRKAVPKICPRLPNEA